jgi:putative beta-lysine N-acetyltransferase
VAKEAITKSISGHSFLIEVYFDPFNRRVRVDDFCGNIQKGIVAAEQAAESIQAEKLICKVRREHENAFLANGFSCEGKIDGYFLGSDMYFFCKYYDAMRHNSDQWILEDQILQKVILLQRQGKEKQIPQDVSIRKAGVTDAGTLAKLYKQVFQVYPTPLFDPYYITKTMQQGTIYYVAEQNGEFISAASAEVNAFYKNAELTDCATLPNHRKQGYVKRLLQKLEQELKESGIYCCYSLSRARSFGMNAAFRQLGYHYRGRLLNNCLIHDQIEDMNIWVKDLANPV